MRTFAQKPKTNLQNTSTARMMPGRSHFEQSRQRSLQSNREELQPGPATTTLKPFGRDFSRVPVFLQPDSEIQARLTVSSAKDKHEQEADRVADQVMRMPEPELKRNCVCGGGCPKCINEQAGHELVQPRAISPNYDAKPTATLIAQN
jgi:hypothetical protein